MHLVASVSCHVGVVASSKGKIIQLHRVKLGDWESFVWLSSTYIQPSQTMTFNILFGTYHSENESRVAMNTYIYISIALTCVFCLLLVKPVSQYMRMLDVKADELSNKLMHAWI